MERQDDEDMKKLDQALEIFTVGEPSADLVERIVAKTHTAYDADMRSMPFMLSRETLAKVVMVLSIPVFLVSAMLQIPSGSRVFKPKAPDMSVENFVNDVVASADVSEEDDPLTLLENVQHAATEERQIDQFLDQVLDDDDDPNGLF